jgi:hypothetical protein
MKYGPEKKDYLKQINFVAGKKRKEKKVHSIVRQWLKLLDAPLFQLQIMQIFFVT